MKKFAIYLLLLAGCMAQSLMAQQSVPTSDLPPNFVRGDDDEQVQTVPKEAPAASATATTTKKYHGGAVMKSVQQVSIFLGSGWTQTGVRMRETALSDLFAGSSVSNNSALSDLQSHQIKASQAAPSVDDFSLLTEVNDLAIQHKLVELLANKSIPAPSASTVYVIYLAPGINSTIGHVKGGVDYLAYHNTVNVATGALHYVVVPFTADAGAHRAAAARACAETAENPNGFDGWF